MSCWRVDIHEIYLLQVAINTFSIHQVWSNASSPRLNAPVDVGNSAEQVVLQYWSRRQAAVRVSLVGEDPSGSK